MNRLQQKLSLALVCLVLLAGCESPSAGLSADQAPIVQENGEPAHITVQHCLIGFRTSVRGKNIPRSKEQAEKLANDILQRARDGEDFGKLVREYTDDSPPGIYEMANDGVAPSRGVYGRRSMVPAFGNTGFPLEVGEYGIAEFDEKDSPYGWHIVKRVK